MSKNHKVFYRTNYDVIKNEHVVEFALDLRVYAKSKEELTEERINELQALEAICKKFVKHGF